VSARLVVTALLTGLLLAVSAVASAAVLPSTDATHTVLVKGNATLTFPTGTTRAAILAALKSNYGASTKPSISSFKFVIAKKTYKLTKAERKSITPAAIDWDAMADAVLASDATTATPIDLNALILGEVSTAKIDKIVKKYAKASAKDAKDIRYIYDKKKKKMAIAPAAVGYKLATATGRKAIQAALRDLAVKGYKGSLKTANTYRKTVQPKKTTKSQLGKALVVDLSKRRVTMYNKGKKTKTTYRVAIGMKGYGTPPGWYYVGAKRPRPTWSNPGSSWAANMPATIGPGASNPLGLRAMNLYNAKGNDTGYRIHGTAKLSSIGTAASHGCIRVANSNIVKLYKKTPKGTPVIVQP
jgi:lipoprotein-anchoring transpeptidase ErfK/SrfK